jgi:hypothetical protein
VGFEFVAAAFRRAWLPLIFLESREEPRYLFAASNKHNQAERPKGKI